MEIASLNVNNRNGVGKNNARRTRRIGHIPGVIYDINGNKLVEIEKKDLDAVLSHNRYNAIVNISIGNEIIKAMIMDVQYHPISKELIHVDFKPVTDHTKIHTHIPIRFIGAREIELTGGILQRQRQDVEVECTADNVPKYLEADISRLGLGQSFKVYDMEIAQELTMITKPTEVLVTLTSPDDYVEKEVEELDIGNDGIEENRVEEC